MREVFDEVFRDAIEPPTLHTSTIDEAEYLITTCCDLTSIRLMCSNSDVLEYAQRRFRELDEEDKAISRGDEAAWRAALPRLLEGWKWVARCVLCSHVYDAHSAQTAHPAECRCCWALAGKAVPCVIEKRKAHQNGLRDISRYRHRRASHACEDAR